MEYWDPIAVNGVPEAADEYDSYALEVGRMLRSGTSADEIASYVRRVRIEWMELEWPEYDRRDRDVAQRIIDWYAAVAAPSQ